MKTKKWMMKLAAPILVLTMISACGTNNNNNDVPPGTENNENINDPGTENTNYDDMRNNENIDEPDTPLNENIDNEQYHRQNSQNYKNNRR